MYFWLQGSDVRVCWLHLAELTLLVAKEAMCVGCARQSNPFSCKKLCVLAAFGRVNPFGCREAIRVD
jgi:hypothetical protein